jgi:hypothetical protein
MEQCEAKTGGACTQVATWKHSVHAGNREAGRLLYHSYWCDVHAKRVEDQRRRDRIPPPKMTPLTHEEA